MAERVLDAEMDHDLAGEEPGNRLNGYGEKTVIAGTGEIELEVRVTARHGLIRSLSPSTSVVSRGSTMTRSSRRPRHERSRYRPASAGSLRQRGLAGSNQRGHRCSVKGGRRLASAVAGAIYPLIIVDALRVKIRDEGLVRNNTVHIALGVRADGTEEVRGIWLEQMRGPKFGYASPMPTAKPRLPPSRISAGLHRRLRKDSGNRVGKTL
jgi:putative transposase